MGQAPSRKVAFLAPRDQRLLILLCSLIGCAQLTESPDATKDSIIPQAQPVFTWLEAVQAGDEQQLMAVFSERMRRQFDETGWDRVLETYQDFFAKEFGDYGLEDFAFAYTGGEEEGMVFVHHKGKNLGRLRVIKESADWRVDES